MGVICPRPRHSRHHDVGGLIERVGTVARGAAPSERQQDLAGGAELEHLMATSARRHAEHGGLVVGVGCPKVAFVIQVEAVRKREHALPPAGEQPTIRIELQDRRLVVAADAGGKPRGNRVEAAVQDPDAALRVEFNAMVRLVLPVVFLLALFFVARSPGYAQPGTQPQATQQAAAGACPGEAMSVQATGVYTPKPFAPSTRAIPNTQAREWSTGTGRRPMRARTSSRPRSAR